MAWQDDFQMKKGPGGQYEMPQFKIPNINLPKIRFSAFLIILIIAILWVVFGGYYIVEPDEKGVVLRFGSYVRTTDSGFHLKFPPPIEKVYTPKVTEETRALLQKILDRYDSGLQIVALQLQDVHPPQQVRDSFKDVASAMEDKNRLINESQGYRNSVIPEARGKASQIIKVSQGYKEEKINHAKGDAERFTSILQEYRKARDVTRKRLYIETMEDVLGSIDKYIIEGKSGVLPLLPLDKIRGLGSKVKGQEEER